FAELSRANAVLGGIHEWHVEAHHIGAGEYFIHIRAPLVHEGEFRLRFELLASWVKYIHRHAQSAGGAAYDRADGAEAKDADAAAGSFIAHELFLLPKVCFHSGRGARD